MKRFIPSPLFGKALMDVGLLPDHATNFELIATKDGPLKIRYELMLSDDQAALLEQALNQTVNKVRNGQ